MKFIVEVPDDIGKKFEEIVKMNSIAEKKDYTPDTFLQHLVNELVREVEG